MPLSSLRFLAMQALYSPQAMAKPLAAFHSPPHPALRVRLPNLAGVDLQGGQPPTAVAKGIDANQKSQVEDLAVQLRRVAQDRRFPGIVGIRFLDIQGFPEKS